MTTRLFSLALVTAVSAGISVSSLPVVAANASTSNAVQQTVQVPLQLDATKQFIDELSQETIEKLTKSGLSTVEQKARLAELLENNFALDKISRFVLGRYWRVATPEQRERFNTVFRKNIIEAYGDRIQDYGGQQVAVNGGRLTSNGKFALVDTMITDPNGPSVNVQWRVAAVDGRHQIADVVVEGVSLGATQREEFSAAIARNGGSIDAFLSSLEKQSAKAAIVAPKVSPKTQ